MDPNAAGKIFPPYEFRVERGKIREFADAIEDPDPVYRDHEQAANGGFGGIPAPPTMLRTFLYETRDASEALQVSDWSYIVHGEQEFEYFVPILAGDVLTAQDRIVSVIEKESRRAGKLAIAIIETTFHNQRGERVQIARRTLIETSQRIGN
jgi:peroxisomal enoyl-CoA hydratase 2